MWPSATAIIRYLTPSTCRSSRRSGGDPRPFRIGKIDADPLDQPARILKRRRDPDRRQTDQPAERQRLAPAAQPRRLCLPAVQPLCPPDGAGEHHSGAGARSWLGKSAAQARALALLRQVGLEEKAQQMPAQLSGGQQQRVAIARARPPRRRLSCSMSPPRRSTRR